MGKIAVNHVCGIGIIYLRDDPSQIFLEVKDDGYPLKVMRQKLCIIGGNWIGTEAGADRSPQETFFRELGEELSFSRPIRKSVDLAHLGLAEMQTSQPATESSQPVTEDDVALLRNVRVKIRDGAVPFYDFLIGIPKALLDSADPTNIHQGYTFLASCFVCALDRPTWQDLLGLQIKFGNLSSESLSIITSLDEITRAQKYIAFGYDQVLQMFFLRQGLPEASNLPILEGVEVVCMEDNLPSYQEYLDRYEVLRKP